MVSSRNNGGGRQEKHVHGKKAHTHLDLHERADCATIIPDEFNVFDGGMLGEVLRQKGLKLGFGDVGGQTSRDSASNRRRNPGGKEKVPKREGQRAGCERRMGSRRTRGMHVTQAKDVPRYKHARVVWHTGLQWLKGVDAALCRHGRGALRALVRCIRPFFLRRCLRRVAVAGLAPDVDAAGGVAGLDGGLGGGDGWRAGGGCLDERIVAGAPGAARRRRRHLRVRRDNLINDG